jgi:hypothetical protein
MEDRSSVVVPVLLAVVLVEPPLFEPVVIMVLPVPELVFSLPEFVLVEVLSLVLVVVVPVVPLVLLAVMLLAPHIQLVPFQLQPFQFMVVPLDVSDHGVELPVQLQNEPLQLQGHAVALGSDVAKHGLVVVAEGHTQTVPLSIQGKLEVSALPRLGAASPSVSKSATAKNIASVFLGGGEKFILMCEKWLSF